MTYNTTHYDDITLENGGMFNRYGERFQIVEIEGENIKFKRLIDGKLELYPWNEPLAIFRDIQNHYNKVEREERGL